MDLRTLGVFSFLDSLTGHQTVAFAQQVERLGYSTLWIVEGGGRDALTHAGFLLAKTERLLVGSGIASIWAREASQMAAAAKTAAEISGGRFILGLGANNPASTAARGLPYGKPVSFMRDYVAKLKAATYRAPTFIQEPPIVLAALNAKMLELAARDTQGTLTYFVPPAHTARARAVLGPEKWLCVEQAVMLETDAATARAAARAYMKTYVPTIAAYVKNLRVLGFTDEDFAEPLSDRLVDAIVAWGTEEQLRERLAAQYRAGATHVCILPLSAAGGMAPDERVLAALAPR